MTVWPFLGRDEIVRSAVGAIETGDSLAIIGEAGVGKTSVLGAIASALEATGRTVVAFQGRPSLQEENFGLFADLLGDQPWGADVLETMIRLERTLLDAADRPILILDDLHVVDEQSATLIGRLGERRQVDLVLSSRQSQSPPEPISRLWTHGGARRSEIGPLDRPTVLAIAEQYLGGPLDPETSAWIWRVTNGHPLFLHELILGAVESERLIVGSDGTWRATERFVVNDRLTEVVAARLGSQPGSARDVVDLLAVSGRIVPASLLVEAVGDEALARAEERGLIAVVRRSEGDGIVLSHPMYEEAVRDSIPLLRQRRLLARLLEAARGSADLVPPMELARWHVEAGVEAPPELLVAGANQALARFDPGLAGILAAAAVQAGVGFEAELALAQARCAGPTPAEGEAILDRLDQQAQRDEERATVARIKSRHLSFNRGDPDQAVAALASAAERIVDPPWRNALDSERSIVAAFAGRMDEATELADRLLADESLAVVDRLTCLSSASVGHSFNGRTERALEIYEQWKGMLAMAGTTPTAVPRLPATSAAAALANRGDFAAGKKILVDLHDELVQLGETDHAAAAELNRGVLALFEGHVRPAAAILDLSIETLRRWDPFRVLPFGLGILAYVRAIQGRTDQCRAVLAEATALPESYQRPAAPMIARAQAWYQVATGSLDGGLAALEQAVAYSARNGLRYWQAVVANDFTRLGRPERALAILTGLTEQFDPDLTAMIYPDHAKAVLAEDGRALATVTSRYLAKSNRIEAAEAASQAARFLDSVDRQEAVRCRDTALGIFEELDLPPTPAMRVDDPLLTPREHEVAALAASGMTSRAIAERLTVSRRTVDNTLSSVYAKLGIRGRVDLDPDAFARP